MEITEKLEDVDPPEISVGNEDPLPPIDSGHFNSPRLMF